MTVHDHALRLRTTRHVATIAVQIVHGWTPLRGATGLGSARDDVAIVLAIDVAKVVQGVTVNGVATVSPCATTVKDSTNDRVMGGQHTGRLATRGLRAQHEVGDDANVVQSGEVGGNAATGGSEVDTSLVGNVVSRGAPEGLAHARGGG